MNWLEIVWVVIFLVGSCVSFQMQYLRVFINADDFSFFLVSISLYIVPLWWLRDIFLTSVFDPVLQFLPKNTPELSAITTMLVCAVVVVASVVMWVFLNMVVACQYLFHLGHPRYGCLRPYCKFY
ncbi:hypothetical protein [Alcanivorax sp.]|uniref:hypothetical protein n=1 Tax=Alcanivorax sp. TaxID=1872427 RepID=UPI002589149A|nr:hypothetical protein [Alcanivorax sp.]